MMSEMYICRYACLCVCVNIKIYFFNKNKWNKMMMMMTVWSYFYCAITKYEWENKKSILNSIFKMLFLCSKKYIKCLLKQLKSSKFSTTAVINILFLFYAKMFVIWTFIEISMKLKTFQIEQNLIFIKQQLKTITLYGRSPILTKF